MLCVLCMQPLSTRMELLSTGYIVPYTAVPALLFFLVNDDDSLATIFIILLYSLFTYRYHV